MLASCDTSPPHFNSADITGENFAKDFKLSDTEGRQRTRMDFRGKYVLVFFGFTHCPGVCPITLTQLTEVRKKLGADKDRVQVVFITVDPERDSAEVLKNYVKAFDTSFVGLHGDKTATAVTAKEFNISYEKVPMGDNSYRYCLCV